MSTICMDCKGTIVGSDDHSPPSHGLCHRCAKSRLALEVQDWTTEQIERLVLSTGRDVYDALRQGDHLLARLTAEEIWILVEEHQGREKKS